MLATPDPDLKCIITREAVSRMRSGKLRSIRPSIAEVRRTRAEVGLVDEPERLQNTVAAGQTGKRYPSLWSSLTPAARVVLKSRGS